jgi:hypothetical protein
MSLGANQYPISQLINRLIQDYGYSTVEFVKSLGFRNIERGIKRLVPWLEQADGFEKILKQIVVTYPEHADELQSAVAATKAVRAAEFEAAWIEECKAEKETFRPFLHAEGERTVPSQICMFGVSGGHRRWTSIQIPQNILDLPGEEQLAALAELMKGYREKYKGQVPFFAALTGFKYVRLLDYSRFDKDGRFIEQVDRPFRSSPCSVRLM